MSNSIHDKETVNDHQTQIKQTIPDGCIQHSLTKSILMHLLPGIPILLFYLITAPYFMRLGFPPAFALSLAAAVVLIPVEMGILLYVSKKTSGMLSLRSILPSRKPVPWRQSVFYCLVIVAWSCFILIVFSKPIGGFITDTLFSWVPPWFIDSNPFEGTKPVLIVTWTMILVFGSVLGPAVEEFYFRGYLLPRISHCKGWAPVLNAFLFSAYHFWSPWEVITRAIAVFPVSFVAYKKQNIYIGMIAHLILNIIFTLFMLPWILK